MSLPEEDFAKALEVLNSAYQADPAAIHSMVSNSIPCQGVALRDHPWGVVGDSYAVPGSYTVSTLGLLNGVVHALTGKRVAMSWSDTKDENGRFKFIGFVEYKEPVKS